jgi:predicted TIM-barrel fold metal-dependent hydrolase
MISDLGLFLITHAGQDSAFEPPFKSNPASLRSLHERHPKLKLVIAHGGSWKMWEDVPRYLAGLKNVWFDLAFVGECMEKSAYRRLVDTLKVDNLLFGTDSPWCDQLHALELLHDLQLGNDAEAAICSGNALNLIKL